MTAALEAQLNELYPADVVQDVLAKVYAPRPEFTLMTPPHMLNAAKPEWHEELPGDPSLKEIIKHGLPQRGLSREVNTWRAKNAPNLWRGARRVLAARALNLPTFYGAVWLRKITAQGDVTDYGLASLRVVTTAGVGYIVDAFQNLTEVENFKYHGIGTGTNAESSADTALQTELTTQYSPDNTRATGTVGEGASGNIYATTGTITVDAAATITEHGVFSQAATGGGVLLDRSVFAAVGLAASDSLQVPYQITFPAGS